MTESIEQQREDRAAPSVPATEPKRGRLGRERGLLVICAILGAGVGAYRLWSAKPEYAAYARLYVEPVRLLSDSDTDSALKSVPRESWAIPPDLLEGTELASLAAEIGQLRTLPAFAGVDDVAWRIASNLKVTSTASGSGRGQIHDLTYNTPNPETGRRVLESVIAAYELAADQWRTRRIEDTLAALEKQREFLFERVQRKQLELSKFREANPPMAAAADSQALDSRLKTLVDAQVRAELRRIEAEVRLAALQAAAARDGAPIRGSRDGPATATAASTSSEQAPDAASVMQAANERRGFPPPALVDEAPSGRTGAAMARGTGGSLADVDLEAEAQYVERLEREWGPEHPKLIEAKARLTELRRRVQYETARSIRAAEASVRLCVEEEKRLEQTVAAQRALLTGGAGGSPDAAMQMQILQHVVDRTEAALALLSERVENLKMESAVGNLTGAKITTLVAPHASEITSSQSMPKLFLVPLGVGVLAGFALMYLQSPRPATGAAYTTASPTVRRKVRRKSFVLGEIPELPLAAGRGSQRVLGTWVLRNARSGATTAFRKLARSFWRSLGDMPWRCVLVTSAEAREGKSAVLANLAVSLAQGGRRVLLVDGNFEHPSQHVLLSDILSMDAGAGAEELSIDRLEEGRAVTRTQLETLGLVSAWPKPAQPREVLRSIAFREFMVASAAKYDVVLIDAPAATEREDVELLAEVADVALVVVRESGGERKTIDRAREAFGQVNLPSLGVVVNHIPTGTRAGGVSLGSVEELAPVGAATEAVREEASPSADPVGADAFEAVEPASDASPVAETPNASTEEQDEERS